MKPQRSIVILIAAGAILFATEIAVVSRNTARERPYDPKDRQTTSMVDHLDFTDTAEAFKRGRMDLVNLARDDGPARVVLVGERQDTTDFPRVGTWSTREIQTDFPFTEMVPSWNASTPTDTGVIFSVRVRSLATGEWTPWLRIGAWGRMTETDRRDSCDFASVKQDTLTTNAPADAYQFRATLQSFTLNPQINPSIRRIVICYSGAANEESLWAKSLRLDPGPPERLARDLDVPYFPQGDNDEAITGMTCSPTSVSMVLHFWGVTRPPMENCLAIWDDHNKLFGNWSNATQRAGELGMDAWLERFRNWDQVKEKIAQGQPVIASIEFGPNEYPDSPVADPAKGTGGHLIVIRGFKPDGTVIVNDPASRKKGPHALYPPRGLAHAWFGHGGVGYIIRPPAKAIPASLVRAPFRLPTSAPATAPVVTRNSQDE